MKLVCSRIGKSAAVRLIICALGALIIWGSFYWVKIPPTFRRVNLLEGYLLKSLIVLIGAALIFFAISSFCYKYRFFRIDWIKKRLVNFSLLLMSLIISLIILEIFLQVTAAQSCQQPDLALHHSYRPNCQVNSRSREWDINVSINSYGLRDDPILSKDNFDRRILMLGDSFTVGWGVSHEDTFSEILQQQFQANGFNLDVINGGSTSYSPVLEYLFLREKGLALNPDMVILNLDIGDIQNDRDYLRQATFDASGKLRSVTPQQNDVLTWLYTKIKLIRFLESPLVVLDSLVPADRAWASSNFYDLDYDQYLLTRGGLSKEEINAYLGATYQYILLIKELCAKNNITFVLLTYPYGHQVSAEEWSQGRHNFGFASGKVYNSLADQTIQDWADSNQIKFISLHQGFKEAGLFPLFYSYDGHFNSAGHQLAGTILFKELVRRELINISSAENNLGGSSELVSNTLNFFNFNPINIFSRLSVQS